MPIYPYIRHESPIDALTKEARRTRLIGIIGSHVGEIQRQLNLGESLCRDSFFAEIARSDLHARLRIKYPGTQV
jgi:hypothetical protein